MRNRDNELIERLISAGDYESLSDALDLVKGIMHEDDIEVADRDDNVVAVAENSAKIKKAVGYAIKIRQAVLPILQSEYADEDTERLYWEAMLVAARYDFDSAIQYAEKNRAKEKKFYLPRRKQLLPIVRGMQRLEDREIRLLLNMMPPGAGKTTLEIMFLCWTGGKHPELQNIMGSHSNSLLQGVYGEVLRMWDRNGEYCWHEIFPKSPVVNTNAKDMRIDLATKKRFETYQFSSVGSGNAGKLRASNVLIVDDIVDGLETALSVDRLDKLWQQFYTDYMQRMQGDCVMCVTATPWSLRDCIDRLAQMHENDPLCDIIKLPALDENDESNFNYPYGVGFSTEFYHNQRDIMDSNSWNALYMMQPVEREGVLYNADELQRYTSVPDRDPDGVIAVLDTKNLGTDYYAMPIVEQYGNDFYVTQFLCDNRNPEVVEPRIVDMLIENKVKLLRVEANAAGARIAKNIQDAVNAKGGITKVSTRWNNQNKETRIIYDSQFVKTKFLFRHEELYKKDKDYRVAMQFVTTYSQTSRNKYDDCVDALSMLANFLQSFEMNKVEIKRRTMF